ncbi:thioredoxin-like 4, chloroplastic [Bidens hawaiensis]|uniref:thioredoxin-like 4, chloroplastic n=1 Tax=Bidens hawaiensis TaxID=980011 RepID=UPI004048F71A
MIHQTILSYANVKNPKTEFNNISNIPCFLLDKSSMRRYPICDNSSVVLQYHREVIHCQPVRCTYNVDIQELSDEDDELCPVECVREIKTDDELLAVLEKAKSDNTLVVVDFYRTACGSCKYIEQGFAKLCKGSGDEEAAVIFLKHNVMNEYDEQSEIAERLRIKTVPLFHFYKNGMLLEAFPTRDKERIKAAIEKYTASATANV